MARPATEEEIDAYLDGDLPEERMRQIEAMARQDPELAAKLTVIGYFSGLIPQSERLPSESQLPSVVILLAVPRAKGMSGHYRDKSDPTSSASGPESWDLSASQHDNHVVLPPEIARQCYGANEQAAAMRLFRSPVSDRENLFEPQLEVTPPPRLAPLQFRVTFANGAARDMVVAAPWGPMQSAWSEPCDPLPADAFSDATWKVRVEIHVHVPSK